MREFFKNEISGWKPFEVVWLFFVCSVICGLSIYWGDTVWGIISAVTGVLYTLLAGKGKLSAYGFGLVNCVLYSVISFDEKLYGETILNGLYYVPMMFVGYFAWRKNMNENTHQVKKRRMSFPQRIWLVLNIALLTAGFGFVLRVMGDVMPFVDGFTTVSSVVAMFVSVKRYSEQWWIWLGVNSFSIYMWWCRFASGSDDFATLLMWCVYLINGIIMLISWEKELQQEKNRKRELK